MSDAGRRLVRAIERTGHTYCHAAALYIWDEMPCSVEVRPLCGRVQGVVYCGFADPEDANAFAMRTGYDFQPERSRWNAWLTMCPRCVEEFKSLADLLAAPAA